MFFPESTARHQLQPFNQNSYAFGCKLMICAPIKHLAACQASVHGRTGTRHLFDRHHPRRGV